MDDAILLVSDNGIPSANIEETKEEERRAGRIVVVSVRHKLGRY